MLTQFRQEYKKSLLQRPYDKDIMARVFENDGEHSLADYLSAIVFKIQEVDLQPQSPLSMECLELSKSYFEQLKIKFPSNTQEIEEFIYGLVFYQNPHNISFSSLSMHYQFDVNLYHSFEKMLELGLSHEETQYDISSKVLHYFNQIYPDTLGVAPESTEFYGKKILHLFMQKVIAPKDIEFFYQKINYLKEEVNVYREKVLLGSNTNTQNTAKTHKV